MSEIDDKSGKIKLSWEKLKTVGKVKEKDFDYETMKGELGKEWRL